MSLYSQSRMSQTKTLPEWVVQALSQGIKDTPEGRKATHVFSAVYPCQLDPQPAEFGVSIGYGFDDIYINNALYVSHPLSVRSVSH